MVKREVVLRDKQRSTKTLAVFFVSAKKSGKKRRRRRLFLFGFLR